MSIDTVTTFVCLRNNCKRVRKEAKTLFVDKTRHRWFGYWWFCNGVLNKSNLSLFTQLAALLSTADKSRCFARNVASNSTFDLPGLSLAGFPLRIGGFTV